MYRKRDALDSFPRAPHIGCRQRSLAKNSNIRFFRLIPNRLATCASCVFTGQSWGQLQQHDLKSPGITKRVCGKPLKACGIDEEATLSANRGLSSNQMSNPMRPLSFSSIYHRILCHISGLQTSSQNWLLLPTAFDAIGSKEKNPHAGKDEVFPPHAGNTLHFSGVACSGEYCVFSTCRSAARHTLQRRI